jgi:ABC-type lipoprotein export system ATPase subunit
MALFRALNATKGITIILVTHDQDIAKFARRIVVLRDGMIVQDTTDFALALQSLHTEQEEDSEAPAGTEEAIN